MEFDLTKKKACSSIGIVIFLLLLLINLMPSISWLQNPDLQVKDPNRHSSLSTRITCDRSHFRYDLCSINGPTVLDPVNAILYSIGHTTGDFEKVKPYPRKLENDIMAKIRVINLKSGPVGPKCSVHHNSPAVVFSVGGFTGNFFHDFTDGFLPLYITLNYLSLENRDVILVVDNARDWWIRKYADIIRAFTSHPIINLENEKITHCFSRAYVGLISHGNLGLDPTALPGPLTLAHFHSFLQNAFYYYSHEVAPPSRRPRLVWVTRTGSVGRIIKNQEKARLVAEEVGFDVVMYSPTKSYPLRDAYKLINTCHAMIGVHGAGLTHMLFLRQGSMMVQILPLGLEWVGRMLLGRPARDLGLEYMEYKIGYNESSLSSKYEKGSHILKDAKELLVEKGWVVEFMNVYTIEQDIRLDLVRFKAYMENVYKKAKSFMDMYG